MDSSSKVSKNIKATVSSKSKYEDNYDEMSIEEIDALIEKA